MDVDKKKLLCLVDDLDSFYSRRQTPVRIWKEIIANGPIHKEAVAEELPGLRAQLVRDLTEKEGQKPTAEKIAGIPCVKYEYSSKKCVLPSCLESGKIRKFIIGDFDLVVTDLCKEHFTEILESEEVMTQEEFIAVNNC